MNTLRRTEPSQRLFDPNQDTRLQYVPHSHQETDGILARWRWTRSEGNPANYPSYDDGDYVREEL